MLDSHGIGYYFGGTLFEKFVLQGRFDDFRRLCEEYSCQHVEASNGTIDDVQRREGRLHPQARPTTSRSCPRSASRTPGRSEMLPPSEWVDAINEDLDAGASLVTLEARESGRSGICRPDGELRYGLIEDVLHGGHRSTSLLFEAPTTALQAHLITRIGPDVNLGNIPRPGRHRAGDAPAGAARRHADRLRVRK